MVRGHVIRDVFGGGATSVLRLTACVALALFLVTATGHAHNDDEQAVQCVVCAATQGKKWLDGPAPEAVGPSAQWVAATPFSLFRTLVQLRGPRLFNSRAPPSVE